MDGAPDPEQLDPGLAGEMLVFVTNRFRVPTVPKGYMPASYFGKRLGSRIRKATAPGRLTKRVNFRVIAEVKYYSEADIRRLWPGDFDAVTGSPRAR